MFFRKDLPITVKNIIGSTLFFTLITLIDAVPLLQMWKWFVIPIGGPVIDYFHIVGVILFARILIKPAATEDFQADKSIYQNAARVLINTTIRAIIIVSAAGISLIMGNLINPQ
jgi:hypothetical protein